MKVVFICKTNLNHDGRILNQIKILQNHYRSNLKIDFILLPDKPVRIDLGENVNIHSINLMIRHIPFLRVFSVLEFTLRALILLFRLKPSILHVEDFAVVLPVYLYKLMRGKSFKLIYDDHEMPNENESLQYRIFQFFEVKLMKQADVVIFANKERMEILQQQHKLENKLTYFLNLPYFEEDKVFEENLQYEVTIADLNALISQGYRFIIHQGVLNIERGKVKLADFSRCLPHNVKILILGASKESFNNFLMEYKLDPNNFYFVGNVPYYVLNKFWEVGSAAVVMYLPTYINNRLCAPNRFYIAVKNRLPVLVNKDNPVLNNFIREYKAGFFIEDMHGVDEVHGVLNYSYTPTLMKELIDEESKKFIDVYENI